VLVCRKTNIFSNTDNMKRFKCQKSRTTLWREARKSVKDSEENVNVARSSSDLSTEHWYDDLHTPMAAVGLSLPVYDDDSDDDDCSYVSFEDGGGQYWFESDSDFDDVEDVRIEENANVSEKLASWVGQYNISHAATNALLAILKPLLPSLPGDVRTLRKTPTLHQLRPISGGHYYHLGLVNGLLYLLQHTDTKVDHIELQVNVDGIPLYKSSSTSLWPILVYVRNMKFSEPFVVGIFCGREKPGSAAEYVKEFVDEAFHVMQHGLVVDEKTITVTIHSFICDAPARAFLKGTKSHSGYSSCEKCTVHGIYDHKVIFPITECPLRTDSSFNNMEDEQHHHCACPLHPLQVGFVTQFGLDYMHMACLGVMRRLLLYWKGPIGPIEVRLGRQMICNVSSRLLRISSYAPVEFARKPRTVDEVMRWKATEFREFIMYSGFIVVQHILNDKLYDHFMLLFISMRILACPRLSSYYTNYAHELLVKFVSDAKILYGNDIMVYNVHCLLHLANDVKNLGCLDDFSAFRFENYLGQLKKLVHKPQQPLQQIVRRLQEQRLLGVCKMDSFSGPKTRIEHHDGPLMTCYRHSTQFRQVQTEKWLLSVSIGNNCVLVDDNMPALIKNIVKTSNDIFLICTKFKTVSEAFLYPLASSTLNICKVIGECDDLFSICLSAVLCKCVCWPLDDDDSYVVIPMLH